MLGGDERLARQIVDEFLREVEEQVTSIQEAIAKGAFEELKRAAHRLKGTAANVGAMALRSQAVRLEAAAGAEDSPAAASLASGIALALQSFRAEVEVGP